MSEMSEAIDNRDDSKVKSTASPSNSDDESETAKLLRSFCRSNDRSGDWKKDDDVWYLTPRRVTDDIGSSEPEKVGIEWKYRNVYSMSVPIDSHLAHSTPRQAAITTCKFPKSTEILEMSTNFHQEKSDTSENESKDVDLLGSLREYLVNYQEANGTPRGEYSFFSLMQVMGQATGHSLVALFYIVVNVSPLIQLFLFVLRFVLDKLISIRNMGYNRQSIVKYAILGGQLVCIYVCLGFIFGFIVMPIFQLVLAMLAKILLFK